MKSLFEVGFRPQEMWTRSANRYLMGTLIPGRRFLGQVSVFPRGSLTPDQKDFVYNYLKNPIDNATEIDNWVHSTSEDDQKAALGSNFYQFRASVNHAADLSAVAYPYYQRLGSDNAEDWYVLDSDVQTLVDFANTVDAAYRMYQNRVKGAQASIPATPSSPTATMAPSAAAAATPPSPTAAFKPVVIPETTAASTESVTREIIPSSTTVLGVPQSTILIGAAAIGGLAIIGLLLKG